MAKISKTHHVTKKGVVKKNPPKTIGRYRVYETEPDNFGDVKINIKLYADEAKARKDFNKRFSEFIKFLIEEQPDDTYGVFLEDLGSDFIMDGGYNSGNYDVDDSMTQEEIRDELITFV